MFGFALVPMLLHKNKPPLSASVPTALVLAVFTATYVTMGFYFSSVVCGIESLMWGTLAWQQWWDTKLDEALTWR